jgi:hypothetical protein
MDDTTKRLWVEADAATRAEVQAEQGRRPAREVMAAALARLRAWHALEKHRRKVHKKAMEQNNG